MMSQTKGFKLDLTPAMDGTLPGWEASGTYAGHDFSLFGSSLPATLRGVAHLLEDLGRASNYVEK
jgi:hypothetical protein